MPQFKLHLQKTQQIYPIIIYVVLIYDKILIRSLFFKIISINELIFSI